MSICPAGMEHFSDRYHFSPATAVGDIIWVSGQVGSDAAGNIPAGMTAQARLAFVNLARVLQAAGAALADVVELTTFHTHLSRDIAEFMAAKDEFFPENFPAWTAVGTTELARPELLVEIRAIAVRGCGSSIASPQPQTGN